MLVSTQNLLLQKLRTNHFWFRDLKTTQDTFIYQVERMCKENVQFKDNGLQVFKIIASNIEVLYVFWPLFKGLQMILCLRQHNISNLLFCQNSNCKKSFGCCGDFEARRQFLLYYHCFNLAGYVICLRKELYNVEYASGTQVFDSEQRFSY